VHWIALIAAALAPAELAFTSAGGVYSMRADGSERRPLVATRSAVEATWSPDGTQLAYTDGRRIMVFAGGASRTVTANARGVQVYLLAWSPDGGRLAFTRVVEESEERYRTEIVTRALATGTETVLVRQPLDARLTSVGAPAWSPDGATIAYDFSRVNRRLRFDEEIRTIPASGGPSRTLLRDARTAAWSPDGRRLAYAGLRDRHGSRCGSHECSYAGEIYVADADGANARRLTRNLGDDVGPKWSPDGSRILFTSDQNLPEGDSYEVYSIAPDGSCLTWLTNGTPASGAPAWRPGSGDRFDPGSCDPSTRKPSIRVTSPKPFAGNLWLGVRHRGLLLSDVRKRSLSYDDCERFRGCPRALSLSARPACGALTRRIFTESRFTFTRRRGALVAESPYNVYVFSGDTVTSFDRRQRRILKALRPLAATGRVARLPAPRVPRALASVAPRRHTLCP
jgi:Tol biopolymer transport system component